MRRRLATALVLASLLTAIPIADAAAQRRDARQAPAPKITDASTRRLVVAPGKTETATLTGQGLDGLSKIEVRRRGRSVRGLTAKVGRGSAQKVPLEVAASKDAKPGDYEIVAFAGKTRLRVPMTVRVEAAPPSPEITRASTRRLVVAPGNSGSATLAGSGLDRVSKVEVRDRGGTVHGITAKVGRGSAGKAPLEVSASNDAKPGDYELMAFAGNTRLRVPLTLRVERATPPPPPPPSPPVITTDAIRMTGLRFLPVEIGTEPIRMTGLRFLPAEIDTEPIRMTGLRFVPVVIDTEPIRMTGLREEDQ